MQNLLNVPYNYQEVINKMTKNSLRDNVSNFVEYKQTLGYSYESQLYHLNKYVEYVQSKTTIPYPVKKITDDYLSTLTYDSTSLRITINTLREFSRYLINRGYKEAYVLPNKLVPNAKAENPYFFTEKEITAFFETIDKTEPHVSFPGREIILPSLFRLLYCCGLRCKEVRILLCSNVNLKEHYIDIINSKGPNSRRIYISKELSEYLQDYNQKIRIIYPNRKYFFPSPRCKKYYGKTFISSNFKKAWLKTFPDFKIKNRPRAYDFRHHFAWYNLNRWAKDGLDVNAMLPYLMKYMGHQTVNETLYYFHFVPEFFQTYKSMTNSLEDIIPEADYDE